MIPGAFRDRGRLPGRQLSVGGVLVLLSIMGVVWVLGGNPLALVGVGPAQAPGYTSAPVDPSDDALAEFLFTVLGDTERVWGDIFAARGMRYEPPVLVLYRGQTESGCGTASANTGPFYCPTDRKIYIDLSFYDQLDQQLGAPGDFAQAYVLAHEVAHHVQHLLGATSRVHGMRGRVSQAEYNDQSVRLELQADFLAGVWAHHAQRRWDILEPGDIDEALGAAAAVGDDRLRRRSGGSVDSDTFTHGTSEQRRRWFQKGLDTGDLDQGDTFAAERL